MEAVQRSTGAPLWALTAEALAQGYRQGSFSPEDVLTATHARIDAVNPGVNAIIAEDRQAARLAAQGSARRWREGAPLSPLDGVPITVKDNLFAAGLPATWGSLAYRDFRPLGDEPAVARLRAAGAVLLGKTNVPEFTLQGFTANALFGISTNPIAPGRTPGGSTGGGAAAVAAAMGALAIGTDGGGSIRRPAAHCGVFGLKPSIGAVPRRGGFRPLLADFEVVGPLARTLFDLRAAFAVMAATTAPSRPFPERPRVGFFSGAGRAPVDGRIRAAAESFAQDLLGLGFEVTAIAAPFDPERVDELWGIVAAGGLAWEVERLGERAARIGDNARTLAARGAGIGLSRYLDALAGAAALRDDAAHLFSNFDLLLCPSIAALAWPAAEPFPPSIDGKRVGPRGHALFTAWMNVAGLCALNVPVALTPADGAIGMQLVAAPGRDLALLDLLLVTHALDGLVHASLTEPTEFR